METAFTPLASLGGGALIGLAAVLLMGGLGRVFGATGILAGALIPTGAGERGWRVALLLGMVTAPPIVLGLTGEMPQVQSSAGAPALLVGGLLVGVGVTLGSGCTSGHGVCGLARRSSRSLVAVLVFMGAAAMTVFVSRHVIGG